jgi:hypothetical protein
MLAPCFLLFIFNIEDILQDEQIATEDITFVLNHSIADKEEQLVAVLTSQPCYQQAEEGSYVVHR